MKQQIDHLRKVGMQIKEYEDRKLFAIQNEDFDAAQDIKHQIQELRV